MITRLVKRGHVRDQRVRCARQLHGARAHRVLRAGLLAGLLAALAACQRSPAPNTAPRPLGTAAEAESLLVDVQALDSTIRVRARYATADNFMGAPLPGYGSNRAFLRRPAADALARVQRALAADGLGLLVWDAYRPVRATLAMVTWATNTGRQSLLTDGYIASRSRHNLGLAIDLTLVRLPGGDEIDMGTPFDRFDSSAHTANASGAVRVMRERLVRAMEREGFRNYDREWWHFSFEVPDAKPYDVPILPR
jgi:zinc D-Ala-D-Ala dipeptidase